MDTDRNYTKPKPSPEIRNIFVGLMLLSNMEVISTTVLELNTQSYLSKADTRTTWLSERSEIRNLDSRMILNKINNYIVILQFLVMEF